MSKVKSELITPALTKDVSFNDKVKDVESALKSRARVQRKLKTDWAKVVQILTENDMPIPARRPSADIAAKLPQSVRIYFPRPKFNKNLDVLVKHTYALQNIANKADLMLELDRLCKGSKKLIESVIAESSLRNTPVELDEKRTKAVKEKLQKAVEVYTTTLESYDETVESVANVKEYIGIVKDVAEISAIAQGNQQ